MEKFIKLYRELLTEKVDEGVLLKHILEKLSEVVELKGAQLWYMSEQRPREKFGDFEGKSHEFNLAIGDTVFGSIIVWGKLSKEEILCLETFASLVSYVIKDRELSIVFKTQTNMLQTAIKEKTLALKELEKQNKRLVKEQKAKNEIFTNVSHELRTPLNSIIGFAHLLQNPKAGSLNEKQASYVNDITTSSVKLLGMVNEILDISKIQARAMQLNLQEFEEELAVQEVINILKPLSDKKNIKILYSPNKRMINADYQKFQQILFNLLSNAIKYTQENGTVEIETEVKNSNLILSVKDNGIGIKKRYHNKIFAKFVQLNNVNVEAEGSTGLGLPIVKELVKMHKGQVYLESVVGKGTKFTVEIPQ